MFLRFLLAIALTAVAVLPAQAQLVRSAPAAGAAVRAVSQIDFAFAAPVNAATAGAQIVMTAMPGMTDHPPMAIKGFTIVPGADGRALRLKLRKPLVPGDYTVSWSVAGADGKRLTGKLSFKVQ